MTSDNVVEWVLDNVSDDAFESEETLYDAIETHPMTSNRLKGWRDSRSGNNWLSDKSSKGTLLEGIDQFNLTDINEKIAGANTIEEIDAVDISKIKTDSVRDNAENIIQGKKGEIVEQVVDTLRGDIENATTLEELEDTISVGEARRRFGGTWADEISTIKTIKSNEFGFLSDRYKKSLSTLIKAAPTDDDTLSNLEAAVTANAPTNSVREELLNKINEKRGG